MLSMCLHYSRLDCYMWPPCVTAWSSPNPTRDVITPFAASLVHAGVKSQINLRLPTGLCSRVTSAICLRRLCNWGTRLNDSPAWIRPVTKDKTRSAVVEINSLKTKWTAELGGGGVRRVRLVLDTPLTLLVFSVKIYFFRVRGPVDLGATLRPV